MSYKEICNFEGIIINLKELFLIDYSKEQLLIQKSIKRNKRMVKLRKKIKNEKDPCKKQKYLQKYNKIVSEEVSFLIKRNSEKGIVYDANVYGKYLLCRLSA